MSVSVAPGDGPYDYAAERADAEAADRTHWRWINGTAHDVDDLPDTRDL